MYLDDHNPPHFHAICNGKSAIVDINTAKAKGKKRLFDCKKYLLEKPYAQRLKNLDFFMGARAEHFTVV